MFGKKKNYEKNTSIMENDDVMINDKKAKVNEYLDSMEYMSKVVLEKKEALADGAQQCAAGKPFGVAILGLFVR